MNDSTFLCAGDNIKLSRNRQLEIYNYFRFQRHIEFCLLFCCVNIMEQMCDTKTYVTVSFEKT